MDLKRIVISALILGMPGQPVRAAEPVPAETSVAAPRKADKKKSREAIAVTETSVEERKVVELKMEEAVRARILSGRKGAENVRVINYDLIDGSPPEVDTSEVWNKLQLSIDFD